MMENKIIPHNQPTLGEEEAAAAAEVIRSGWIAQGERVSQFENRMGRMVGLPEGHSVGLSSGTAALYVALKTLNVPAGSEIIISTYVCSALLNAIHLADCRPVLVDINETDFNMTAETVRDHLSDNTGAVIVAHMFGHPADMAALSDLGVPIIEDCATALGSRIAGEHVGLVGDVGIFSFFASKVIATGQGGMLISKNKDIADRAHDYREFDGRDTYYPRFNFHLSDLQAAVGIVQLRRLPEFLEARKKIADAFIEICNQKSWDFQRTRTAGGIANWYRFVLKGESRLILQIQQTLDSENIKSIVPIEGWELLHNYLKQDFASYPVAGRLSSTTLSLPIYPGIASGDSLDRICGVLKTV